MNDCIFCKIVADEIPSEKVYENDQFLVFMDIRPLSPGHALIIPKKHYRWVWDVPNAGDYFEVAQKVARAQAKAFSTEQIRSKIIGDEVHHAHIWVYPDEKTPGDKMDFKGNAAKIRESLA